MGATVVNSIYTGSSKKAAEIDEANLLLPLATNNWRTIRLTMRYLMEDPGIAYVTGNQFLYFGLCSGSAAPWDWSASTTHSLGVYTSAWSSYGAGTGQFSTGTIVARQGTTNYSSTSISTWAHSYNVAKQCAFSVLIRRNVLGGTGGAALYPYDVYKCQNYTTNVDYPDNRFVALTESNYNTAVNYGQHADAQGNLASVNESLYGTFDHAQIHWNSATPLYVDDLSVHVIDL